MAFSSRSAVFRFLAGPVATLTVLVVLLAPAQLDAGPALRAADFGVRPNAGEDSTPGVAAALRRCREIGAETLQFERGRYNFWPERAGEQFLYVTNNDSGVRRIIFPLSRMSRFRIDGARAEFVFHGNLIPFLIDHSEGVSLTDLSIDWQRTFSSEARVLSNQAGALELSIAPEYPYVVDHGFLVFLDERKQPLPTDHLLEFDPRKREVAWMARDQKLLHGMRASEAGPGRVRLHETVAATPGSVLVMYPPHRLYDAIVVSDSERTSFNRVSIFHAGGMGVVAQRCRDISLIEVRVTPPPKSERMCSLTADATHFSNCSGKILMERCVFQNQMDDATNIHGIYTQITRELGAAAAEVRLVHPQQFGFDYLAPGTEVEFVHGGSLVTYATRKIARAERVNQEYTAVTFDRPLPPGWVVGDALAATAPQPDVTIRDCVIGNNRARGILLGSRGKILIDHNVFHTAGAAILLEGDARYWFEQAGVRDLTIQNNQFDDCNYGVWGKSVIEVGAGIAPDQRAASRYNRNVVVRDNVFRVFDPRLVSIYCVQGFVFSHNQIVTSHAYAAQHRGEPHFAVSDSDGVRFEANDLDGSPL